MAETANLLTDAVLTRTYDEEGLGASREIVRDLLTHVQRLVNARFRAVQTAVTLTVQPARTVYDIAELGSDVVRVNLVRVEGRDLPRIDWRELAQGDPYWLRRVGSPAVWAALGFERFVVYPAPAQARSATVVYTTLATAFTAEDTASDLADDRLPLVRLLTQATLLARGRVFPPLKETLEAAAAEAMRYRDGGGGASGAT